MSHLLWQMIRVPDVDKLFSTGIKPEFWYMQNCSYVCHTYLDLLFAREKVFGQLYTVTNTENTFLNAFWIQVIEMKWSEVQGREGGKNETLWEKFIWAVKWWEVKGWDESVSTICVGKNTGNCIRYFLTVVLFTFCTCCILRCLECIVVSCLACIVVVVLCVLLSSCVYLLYCVCIAVFLYFRCRTAG